MRRALVGLLLVMLVCCGAYIIGSVGAHDGIILVFGSLLAGMVLVGLAALFGWVEFRLDE